MKLKLQKHLALKLIAVYVLAGGSWIVLSDFWAGKEARSGLEPAWKSWGLLAGSSVLLFFLFQAYHRRIADREARLRRTEESARASEAQFRAILDNAADGILAADGAGVIHLFNPAAAEIFGYATGEVLGQNIKMLIPRPYMREHESYRAAGSEAGSSKVVTRGREVIGRRKNGESFPVDLAVSEVSEGAVSVYIAIVRDITDRKKSEEELTTSRERLRSLAARLQSIREEERTRISREIHDELGQSLTGVKMDLSWLKARLPQEETVWQARAQSMSDLVDATIRTVRKIATELRPGVLDNLGLEAALEWEAREFAARTGIACECGARVDESKLGAEQATALFRIFQETLTNVARHARASRVTVALMDEPGAVRLSITDNGRGITAEEQAGSKSLGLLGMRERATMLGGEFRIQARPGQGTCVTVQLPVQSSPQLVRPS